MRNRRRKRDEGLKGAEKAAERENEKAGGGGGGGGMRRMRVEGWKAGKGDEEKEEAKERGELNTPGTIGHFNLIPIKVCQDSRYSARQRSDS